ncbi:hypothetical protein AAFF_G00151950 [Aldrovandia affinis]|uniref:Ig-like domain-containing protein n=1 Tax=Aldrovandia affinis TaxID=143900 RepID=A0AAD7W8S9_9TELE|nr:hypothetical protein AAFF_G00151950 [Aldrovandia affinis]
MSSLIFILLFISGADSVRTVSRLTVLAGGSVTIPCHYDEQYKPHVKYWCKGIWISCTSIVRTDSAQRKGDVSITDDPAQKVFTVTLSNLQEGDSGQYWCVVEINNGQDAGENLYLKVTTGTPDLSVVNNRVTGVVGGSVSVFCHYGNHLWGKEKMWCRSGDLSSCLIAGSSGTSQDRVHLDVNKTQGLLTVTVRELEKKDTGWYWCAAGDLQIPVHINVTEETSGSIDSTTTQHGKLIFDNTIIVLVVIFSLLFLLGTVAMVSWKLWNRHKKTQTERREANQSTSIKDTEYEVTYSTVVVKQEEILNNISKTSGVSGEEQGDRCGGGQC